jgi:hypothetical protein
MVGPDVQLCEVSYWHSAGGGNCPARFVVLLGCGRSMWIVIGGGPGSLNTRKRCQNLERKLFFVSVRIVCVRNVVDVL